MILFQLLLVVDAAGILCFAITAAAAGFDAIYFLPGLALVGGGIYAGFALRRRGKQGWWPLAIVFPIALIGVIFGVPIVLPGHY